MHAPLGQPLDRQSSAGPHMGRPKTRGAKPTRGLSVSVTWHGWTPGHWSKGISALGGRREVQEQVRVARETRENSAAATPFPFCHLGVRVDALEGVDGWGGQAKFGMLRWKSRQLVPNPCKPAGSWWLGGCPGGQAGGQDTGKNGARSPGMQPPSPVARNPHLHSMPALGSADLMPPGLGESSALCFRGLGANQVLRGLGCGPPNVMRCPSCHFPQVRKNNCNPCTHGRPDIEPRGVCVLALNPDGGCWRPNLGR